MGRWLGLGAATALAAVVVAMGLFPGPLLAFGYAAAQSLMQPDAYIHATGLAEAAP
jgi:formate hydrogenlyase subunit 3/multisubunit Na+/H+ antiporter MnhD subunit